MSLAVRLADHMRAEGPMRLDAYMEACLWDARDGYYATKPVFGREGDFITAPEISQIFGEMIALWVIAQWQRIGAPERFTLLELGAGRGVLMRDVLAALAVSPKCSAACAPMILEKSERLRHVQRDLIGARLAHIDGFDEFPQAPLIAIANEFFDALPIRQFRFEDGGWFERFVSIDEAGQFLPIWQAVANVPEALAHKLISGVTIEVCEGIDEIGEALGDLLRARTGALLAIDYGEWEGVGDSFQALYQHKPVSPFEYQGEADLTAHVNFSALANAIALNGNFMTQGEFLLAYGASERLRALIAENPVQSEALSSGFDRLTLDAQMGKIFKVLAVEA